MIMKTSRILLFTLVCGWLALFTADIYPKLSVKLSQAAAAPNVEPARRAYGQLPLLFETNRGQVDARVNYVARGGGYTVFLRPAEAVLRLQTADEAAALRMQLVGASATARARGLMRSATNITYLHGKTKQAVENYERVAFEQVWPGIDVVYHGAQRQLEYDFELRAGANPKRIKLQLGGLSAPPRLNEAGELILNVAEREVRWHKPVAWQMIDGARCEIACEYQLEPSQQISFKLGDYDHGKPLVIDPALVYSTFLGGTGADSATGIAVDTAGNAYVCGTTSSLNFPVMNALQASKDSTTTDAYVAKLNAAGTALLYATYLGGSGSDTASAIAVDATGNAYVAGFTTSADFPRTAGALQNTLNGNGDGFVAKLNAAGNALAYATLLGGNGNDLVNGLAIDANGNTYLTGQTDSTNFPTAGAVTAKNGTPLFKSVNSGAQWNASATGLAAGSLTALAQDPLTATTLYAISAQGFFKSTDNGGQWSFVGAPPLVMNVRPLVTSFAIDAKTPSTIYLGTSVGMCKSVNGGQSFELKSTGMATGVNAVVVDPQTPATVYAGTSFGVFKTTNGGEAWALTSTGLNATFTRRLVIDPSNAATLYAATNRGVFKTTDRATNWGQLSLGQPGSPDILALAIDASAPNTLYAYNNFTGGTVYKTTDGGASWNASSGLLETRIGNLTVRTNAFGFAANGARVLAATSLGLFVSTDGGNNWTHNTQGLTLAAVAGLLLDRTNPATIYAATVPGPDAFATKLNASGNALIYSRYLGSDNSDIGRSIAVDTNGNAWLTGQTTLSNNFPTVNATQPNSGLNTDIFVTKVNASGSALSFSTYLGGGSNDLGYGIGLDGAGNAYVAGWTQSFDFPVVNALIGSAPAGTNAVVAKFKADGSAVEYATYLGGSRNDEAFAVAVDAAGNAIITGNTMSPDFPLVAPLQGYNGVSPSDAFITRLSQDGKRVGFSTYLGGTNTEQSNAIALDAQGNVFVAGTTLSQDFPTLNPLHPFRGGSDAFIAKLSPSADLALTMSASPAPVALNNNLTYTIRVTNNGELNATGVMLNDVLPSGATFVSANASQGSCTGTATVNCNLGNLNVGATATVTIVIQPPARLTISNTATVTANEADGNTANNRVTVESAVNFYDLAVTMTTAYDRAVAGNNVYYFLTMANRAGVTANNIIVNFTLPNGMTHVSCLPEFGTCGGTGNNRTVTTATLASDESRAVTFTASLNSTATVGTILTANAAIMPVELDAVRNNNNASARVTLAASLFQAKTNGRILYYLYDGFTQGVSGWVTVNPDGSNQQRLPDLGRNPTWSPDGTRLAFLTTEPGARFEDGDAVFVSAPDGTNKRRVAVKAATNEYSRLSWSPDGSKIVFTSRDSRYLALANADGSGQVLLPNSPTGTNDPDWSPDGGQLAFAKDGLIWKMNLDGSGLQRLSTRREFGELFLRPRWSPDGTKILFTRHTSNHEDVTLINADGTGQTRAFNLTESQRNATWSPDGTSIVFATFGPLHTINYDGSNLRRLPNVPTVQAQTSLPEWQPLPASGTPQPLPNPVTYMISGYGINEEGKRGSLSVPFTGSLAGIGIGEDTANGGADLPYTIVRLPRGGTYTLTPQHPAYRFEPASRTYSNLNSDITGADFRYFFRPLSIRGRITDSAGLPMAGVSFITDQRYSNIETDEDGRFAFTNLFGGGSYTIQPLGFGANDAFEPRQTQFENMTESKTANFIGRRERFEVTATVANEIGLPSVGVTVTLSGNGVNRTAVTESAGQAKFADVTGGFVYTMKASLAGATFAPAEQRVVVNRPTGVSFYGPATTAAVVSAASYRAADITLGSIVSVFGTGLAGTTKSASSLPLPIELEGVTATLTGRGYQRQCEFFFVSPQQLNLLVPVPFDPFFPQPGDMLLTIRRAGIVVAVATFQARGFASSLFSTDATGKGLAAALALRVKADGSQVYESVARFDPMLNRFVAVPLDVSNPAEQVFLVLFGTGIGYRPNFRTDVLVNVANQLCEIFYAGRQGSLAGLDQVNVLLPRTLAGRGEADIQLTTAEGGAANVVKLNLK